MPTNSRSPNDLDLMMMMMMVANFKREKIYSIIIFLLYKTKNKREREIA